MLDFIWPRKKIVNYFQPISSSAHFPRTLINNQKFAERKSTGTIRNRMSYNSRSTLFSAQKPIAILACYKDRIQHYQTHSSIQDFSPNKTRCSERFFFFQALKSALFPPVLTIWQDACGVKNNRLHRSAERVPTSDFSRFRFVLASRATSALIRWHELHSRFYVQLTFPATPQLYSCGKLSAASSPCVTDQHHQPCVTNRLTRAEKTSLHCIRTCSSRTTVQRYPLLDYTLLDFEATEIPNKLFQKSHCHAMRLFCTLYKLFLAVIFFGTNYIAWFT